MCCDYISVVGGERDKKEKRENVLDIESEECDKVWERFQILNDTREKGSV